MAPRVQPRAWAEEYLALIAQQRLTGAAAARAVGVSANTPDKLAARDPGFRARIVQARRQRALSWHAEMCALLELGHTRRDALAAIGLSWDRYNRILERDPELARQQEAVYRADRTRRRRSLLYRLRMGQLIKEAAAGAGVPLPTLKRWRRALPGFDAAVLDAAARGGRALGRGRSTPRPTTALSCPGARCGTTTGYDYGCREAACTAAKTAPILTRRKETRDEQ